MSNLSAAQRAKLALSDFAWPAKRLYPVMDASDMQGVASLIGKAPPKMRPVIKRNAMMIARRKGFAGAIPKAWMDSSSSM